MKHAVLQIKQLYKGRIVKRRATTLNKLWPFTALIKRR
jgi:hypothetical protein